MDITIYRYRIINSNWGAEIISEELMKNISVFLNEQPFYGDVPENKYGFVQCQNLNKKVYGIFAQKFPKTLIDYDAVTKVEVKKETIDCGEYLFLLDFENYDIYLQAKRSTDLPNKEEINKRFTSLLKLIFLERTSLMFSHMEETKDETNRERIVEIFYNEADKVLELELDDFDINLIGDQKRKRQGKRQTYFNPIEEYQEAMEEAAIRISQHADKAYVRAKKGESLKKDPISRALLEGSNKPTKITYIKDEVTYTEYGVNRSKIEINVDGDDYKITEQITNIDSNIFGSSVVKKKRKKKDSDQTSLDM